MTKWLNIYLAEALALIHSNFGKKRHQKLEHRQNLEITAQEATTSLETDKSGEEAWV